MKNVMVLFGGQSNEHEVSVVSAKNVLINIDRTKYNVVSVGITREGKWLLFDNDYESLLPDKWEQNAREVTTATSIASPYEFVMSFATRMGLDSIDAVFPVMHGINAEDGTIQGMLQLCGIPCVGPGVLASSMGMDKEISKIVFEKAGIPQAKYAVINRYQLADASACEKFSNTVREYIEYPCFVKPVNAGSSVGVHKVKQEQDLLPALQDAAKYDAKVMVEEFINGREIECAVIGNNDNLHASVLGEIIASNEFYDYNAKYIDNKSQCVVPADLTGESSDAVKQYAVDACKALQVDGLSRVDFFVDKETEDIYINEVNTLPGFTSISMYPMLWGASGLSYADLIDKLITLAIEKHRNSERKLVSE